MRYVYNCIKFFLLAACFLLQSPSEASKPPQKLEFVSFAGLDLKASNDGKTLRYKFNEELYPILKEREKKDSSFKEFKDGLNLISESIDPTKLFISTKKNIEGKNTEVFKNDPNLSEDIKDFLKLFATECQGNHKINGKGVVLLQKVDFSFASLANKIGENMKNHALSECVYEDTVVCRNERGRVTVSFDGGKCTKDLSEALGKVKVSCSGRRHDTRKAGKRQNECGLYVLSNLSESYVKLAKIIAALTLQSKEEPHSGEGRSSNEDEFGGFGDLF